MSRDEALQCIVRALPYSQHIQDWDTSKDDQIRFTWRHDRFTLNYEHVRVEQVEGGCLAGSNLAIAVEELIRRSYANLVSDKPKPKMEEVNA